MSLAYGNPAGMSDPVKGIIVFLVLAVMFSIGPWAVMIHAHSVLVGYPFGYVWLMWAPASAAYLTCVMFRIDPACLGWRWRPLRYEFLGYLLPACYAAPAYIACWLLVPHSFLFGDFARGQARSYGFVGHPVVATLLLAVPITATAGVIQAVSASLGEEIGWRGFLLPRLIDRTGWQIGCLIGGLIWAAWHVPILLFADYNSGTPKVFALTCFTVMAIALTFQLGWLRLRSGSLWPCAVLHACHNILVQNILDPMTSSKTPAIMITTEFGGGLAITTAITALILWKMPMSEVDRNASLQEAGIGTSSRRMELGRKDPVSADR